MAHGINHVYPEIHHIELSMDVWATLIVGEKRAILVDTGFGIDNLHAVCAEITPLEPEVILTHAHYDHALGAWQFSNVKMFSEDAEDFREYTTRARREWVLEGTRIYDVPAEIDVNAYLNAELAMPEPLEEGKIDLGGIAIEVLRVPGHTPGSAVIYIPKYRLLLSGDDWNPCTWLFFARALPAGDYRENMRGLMKVPFENVLCSHRSELYPAAMLRGFIDALTDESLNAAKRVEIEPYPHIHTCEAALPMEQTLVFDRDKWQNHGKSDKDILK